MSGSHSYKPNLSRNVTRKWAEARKVDYGGDDWGDDDDYDDFDDEPPYTAPTLSNPTPRQYQTHQSQPSYSSQSSRAPAPPPAASYSNRRLSFDQDDDSHLFNRPQAAAHQRGPPPTHYRVPSQPSPYGQTNPQRPPSRDAQYGLSSVPPPTGRPSMEGYRQEQSRPSMDNPRSSQGREPSDSPRAAPPRKSSLSQQAPPSSFEPSTITTPPSRPLGPPGSAEKPLPFIRPADIYKRMEEEKERERRSQESSRPSMDTVRKSLDSPEQRRRSEAVPGPVDEERPSSPPRSLQPALDTVQERKSEYGFENIALGLSKSADAPVPEDPLPNFENAHPAAASRPGAPMERIETNMSRQHSIASASSRYTDRPDPVSASTVDSRFPSRAASQLERNPSGPGERPSVLPTIGRMSSFGRDFMPADSSLPSQQDEIAPPPPPKNEQSGIRRKPSAPPVPSKEQAPFGTPEKTSLQHKNSHGYRSLVKQAFQDEQTQGSPTNTLPRTNSMSTTDISPIVERKPSHKFSDNAGLQSSIEERPPPPAKASQPAQQIDPHEEEPLQPPRRLGTNRRDSRSPARRPLSVEVPRMPEPQAAVIDSNDDTIGSPSSPGDTRKALPPPPIGDSLVTSRPNVTEKNLPQPPAALGPGSAPRSAEAKTDVSSSSGQLAPNEIAQSGSSRETTPTHGSIKELNKQSSEPDVNQDALPDKPFVASVAGTAPIDGREVDPSGHTSQPSISQSSAGSRPGASPTQTVTESPDPIRNSRTVETGGLRLPLRHQSSQMSTVSEQSNQRTASEEWQEWSASRKAFNEQHGIKDSAPTTPGNLSEAGAPLGSLNPSAKSSQRSDDVVAAASTGPAPVSAAPSAPPSLQPSNRPPPQQREESFRPVLPGGWQSTTSIVKSEAPASAEPQQQRPGAQNMDSTESIPTATAPKAKNWKENDAIQSQAFAAAATAGAALAGIFSGRALMKGDDDSETSSMTEEGPTGANKDASLIAKDFAAEDSGLQVMPKAPTSKYSAAATTAEPVMQRGRTLRRKGSEDVTKQMLPPKVLPANVTKPAPVTEADEEGSPTKESERWWSDEEEQEPETKDIPAPLRMSRALDAKDLPRSLTAVPVGSPGRHTPRPDALEDEIVKSLTPKSSRMESPDFPRSKQLESTVSNEQKSLPPSPLVKPSAPVELPSDSAATSKPVSKAAIPTGPIELPAEGKRRASLSGQHSAAREAELEANAPKPLNRVGTTPLPRDLPAALMPGIRQPPPDPMPSLVEQNVSPPVMAGRGQGPPPNVGRGAMPPSGVRGRGQGPPPGMRGRGEGPSPNMRGRGDGPPSNVRGRGDGPSPGMRGRGAPPGSMGRGGPPGPSGRGMAMAGAAVGAAALGTVAARGSSDIPESVKPADSLSQEAASIHGSSSAAGIEREAPDGVSSLPASDVPASSSPTTQARSPSLVTTDTASPAAKQPHSTDQGQPLTDTHQPSVDTSKASDATHPDDKLAVNALSPTSSRDMDSTSPTPVIATALVGLPVAAGLAKRHADVPASADEQTPHPVGETSTPSMTDQSMSEQGSTGAGRGQPPSGRGQPPPGRGQPVMRGRGGPPRGRGQGPPMRGGPPPAGRGRAMGADGVQAVSQPGGSVPTGPPAGAVPVPGMTPGETRSAESSEQTISALPLEEKTDQALHQPPPLVGGVSPTERSDVQPAARPAVPNQPMPPAARPPIPTMPGPQTSESSLTTRTVNEAVTIPSPQTPQQQFDEGGFQGPSAPPVSAAAMPPRNATPPVQVPAHPPTAAKGGPSLAPAAVIGAAGASPRPRASPTPSGPRAITPKPSGTNMAQAHTGAASSQTAPNKSRPSINFDMNRDFPSDKTPFRDIMTLGNPQQRIQALNENREIYSKASGHLENWLTYMNTPENADVFSGQQGYGSDYGSGQLSSPPQRRIDSASGYKQMQEDGRRLLAATGKYGGKASVLGKGLFSKGRDKLRSVSSGKGHANSAPNTNDGTPTTPKAPPKIPTPQMTPIEESSLMTYFGGKDSSPTTPRQPPRQPSITGRFAAAGRPPFSPISEAGLGPVARSTSRAVSAISEETDVQSQNSRQQTNDGLNSRVNVDKSGPETANTGAVTSTRNSKQSAEFSPGFQKEIGPSRNSSISDVSSIGESRDASNPVERTISPPAGQPQISSTTPAYRAVTMAKEEEAARDRENESSLPPYTKEQKPPVSRLPPGADIVPIARVRDGEQPVAQRPRPFSFDGSERIQTGSLNASMMNDLSLASHDTPGESPLPSARRPAEDMARLQQRQMPVQAPRQSEEGYRIPGPYVQEFRSPRARQNTSVLDDYAEQPPLPLKGYDGPAPMTQHDEAPVAPMTPPAEAEKSRRAKIGAMFRSRSKSRSRKSKESAVEEKSEKMDKHGKGRRGSMFNLTRRSSTLSNEDEGRVDEGEDERRDKKRNSKVLLKSSTFGFGPSQLPQASPEKAKKKRFSGIFSKPSASKVPARASTLPLNTQQPSPSRFSRSRDSRQRGQGLEAEGFYEPDSDTFRIDDYATQYQGTAQPTGAWPQYHGFSAYDAAEQQQPPYQSHFGVASYDRPDLRINTGGNHGQTSGIATSAPPVPSWYQRDGPVRQPSVPYTRAQRDISYGQDNYRSQSPQLQSPFEPTRSQSITPAKPESKITPRVAQLHTRSRSPKLGRTSSEDLNAAYRHFSGTNLAGNDSIGATNPTFLDEPYSAAYTTLGTFSNKKVSPIDGITRSNEEQEKPWAITLPSNSEETDAADKRRSQLLAEKERERAAARAREVKRVMLERGLNTQPSSSTPITEEVNERPHRPTVAEKFMGITPSSGRSAASPATKVVTGVAPVKPAQAKPAQASIRNEENDASQAQGGLKPDGAVRGGSISDISRESSRGENTIKDISATAKPPPSTLTAAASSSKPIRKPTVKDRAASTTPSPVPATASTATTAPVAAPAPSVTPEPADAPKPATEPLPTASKNFEVAELAGSKPAGYESDEYEMSATFVPGQGMGWEPVYDWDSD